MTAPPFPAGRNRGRTHAGLTLVELLVALALGVVILVVASDLLISSSRTASDVQGRNDLLRESQIAQNYVVAQLREAVFVFPDGTDVNLGGTATTAPPGSAVWRVGSGAWPVVAVVRPPRRVGSPCVSAAAPGSPDPDACYQFLAYYPLPRATWVDAVSGADDPGPDAANGDRWVLVEYRSTYPAPPTLSSLPAPGATYTPPAGEARLLLDYVQPPALAVPGTPPLFTVNNLAEPGPWTQAPGDISVTVNLAVSRRIGRRDVTVPNRGSGPAASVSTVGAVPRNLGKLPN